MWLHAVTSYVYFMYIGNSNVYIIVGVIIGVIIVLSLLFIIMICCFMRRKGTLYVAIL